MVSIQSQYSQLYANRNPIGRQAEISAFGTNDTQKTFASVLEGQMAQNPSASTDTWSDAPADLDEYYSNAPAYHEDLLKSAHLLLPNAETIQSIADNACDRLRTMLEACNIPEAPEKITYDTSGEMVLPDDYTHKEAFKEALADNPGLDRELRDLNAISSHYAGIQRAQAESTSSGHSDIALIIGPQGVISIQADGEPLFTPSDTAGMTGQTSGGSTAGTPESVMINGRTVIVSGHDLDEMEGRSLFRSTQSGNIQRLREFAENEMNSGEHTYVNGILMIDGQPAMAVSTTPLKDGAQNGYSNVEYFNADGQTGLGAIQPGTEDGYYRSLVSEYMEIVDVERRLKESYGEDIKLVYSHLDNCHIMLTPDDARYDQMASAEEGVQTLLNNISNGHINRSAVEDLLAARGYTV